MAYISYVDLYYCRLSKYELTGRLDAFLERCYRYGFASKTERVDVLFYKADVNLFQKLCLSGHFTSSNVSSL